jgi:hypothetical protein
MEWGHRLFNCLDYNIMVQPGSSKFSSFQEYFIPLEDEYHTLPRQMNFLIRPAASRSSAGHFSSSDAEKVFYFPGRLIKLNDFDPLGQIPVPDGSLPFPRAISKGQTPVAFTLNQNFLPNWRQSDFPLF